MKNYIAKPIFFEFELSIFYIQIGYRDRQVICVKKALNNGKTAYYLAFYEVINVYCIIDKK